MKGGLIFFRGAGAAARSYLESDHSHADEYYLEDGTTLAHWSALDADGNVRASEALEGDAYQSWVDWKDPATGTVRGVPRDETRVASSGDVVKRPASPRFAEMTVNCDKSLSVAAALFPGVSGALDQAQQAAAAAMGEYLAQHSVTRVGPRGAQRFVPVERFEQVAVTHRTSRAGDPHRHIHVQWNTRVYADGAWRGLHTGATLKQQGALRGIGEAVIAAHPELMAALQDAGLTFDARTGKVVELTEHAKVLSKRAQQVQHNVARLEQAWRAEHPGEEPDKALRRRWDQQAWAQGRPHKTHADGSAEERWIRELHDAGLRTRGFTGADRDEVTLADVDTAAVCDAAIADLEATRSAWSVADLEGALGVQLGRCGITADRGEVSAWVQETAATAAETLMRVDLDVPGEVPSWVRWITSERVVAVEHELRETLGRRGTASVVVTSDEQIGTLTIAQSQAARALGGQAPLVVVEGAAGAGKTTMLAEAARLAREAGGRVIVVAPTLRAAQEAGHAIGEEASSAHKLLHEYGHRRDRLGRWHRLRIGDADPVTGGVYEGPTERYRLDAGTRIVVDEAGMVDQDVAVLLLRLADETGATVGLIGDRAQLPAVGRGGVLEMAVAAHPTPLELADVHRFGDDHAYAQLSLRMRAREDPETIFDELARTGHLVVHDTLDEAREAIAADCVARARAGGSVAVATATNDDATALNALVQAAHAEAGHTKRASVPVAGSDELTIRIGDRIMTRRNDATLGVANRDTWQVRRVHRDQSVTVTDGKRQVRLPAAYITEHTHLAYASTEFGVQGATVDAGHGIVTDSSTAAGVYVSATRGRHANTLHVVAESVEQGKDMFVEAMRRDGGDRGVEAARTAARRDLDGITGTVTEETFSSRTQQAWWDDDPEQAVTALTRIASGAVWDDSERRPLGKVTDLEDLIYGLKRRLQHLRLTPDQAGQDTQIEAQRIGRMLLRAQAEESVRSQLPEAERAAERKSRALAHARERLQVAKDAAWGDRTRRPVGAVVNLDRYELRQRATLAELVKQQQDGTLTEEARDALHRRAARIRVLLEHVPVERAVRKVMPEGQRVEEERARAAAEQARFAQPGQTGVDMDR